ncbi:hypothetical protein OBBRIDRAFT_809768 [Obba rivulosa]|uniref:Enoyl reductase (ER) domain-containing protein n=1 Tax=Obba rivulosa TaxID=1052685 RepID=A0A8E2J6B9_9APHY|nr:hypothetical protein OBBRIDRAFT_809768 [Obba rivulosa]
MNSPRIPTDRKAWHIMCRVPPGKALQFETNLLVPRECKEGDVLVRVQAAALSPRPNVAEYDLAGIVADCSCTKWRTSDTDYGFIPYSTLVELTHQVALSQYTGLPAANLLRRPPNVSPIQASGLTLVGLIAYQAIFSAGQVKPSQRLLVNGGSAAVGAFVIQSAKVVGYTVAGSASGENERYFRERGPQPNGFDVPAISIFLWDVLMRPKWLGGTKGSMKLVYILTSKHLPGFIVVKPIKKDFQDFGEHVTAEPGGRVKLIVDSVFSFEDALEAYEHIMSGRATGTVAIEADPEAEWKLLIQAASVRRWR